MADIEVDNIRSIIPWLLEFEGAICVISPPEVEKEFRQYSETLLKLSQYCSFVQNNEEDA